jgi:EmrB/QacA subfamily drug resistance transporter
MSETAGEVRPAPRKDAVFSDPVLRRLSIVVILGAVMSILDTTIVNVALDTLAREFHTSVSTIQWVTTGYLLALAIVIPMSGWTVERFGAKRTWITSLALFTIGSALCGLAWSSQSLILFRVLQGVGGGMIMPVGQTIMARAAGPQRMGRVMSILGVPTLLAPIIGPVLGGLIIDNASWRWIFYVNVPIGILAIALSAVFLSPGGRTDAGRFDFLGMALLSPGLAIIVYGLSEAGGGSGFGSTTVIACIVIGVLLVAAFVLHALRVDRPLLDMHLFRDRGFAVSNVAIFIFGAGLYAGMILLPLFSQVVKGDSALIAGLSLAPQGIGAMITMPYGGKLTDRIGAGTVVPIGMGVFLLGTLFFTQLAPDTSYTWIGISLFVRGMGMGWVMMPLMAAAYANLTRTLVPRATTTLNIMMRVGGSFGTALVAVVLQRQVTSRLPHLPSILGSVPSSITVKPPPAVAQQISDSFGYTFWVVVAMTAVGLVATLLLPKGRPGAPVVPERGEAQQSPVAAPLSD